MRAFTFLFICLSLTTVVSAKELQTSDFAHGLELVTDGAAAIYRLPLPASVYGNVVRPDLGDIRIFNADNEIVPHTIRRHEYRETSIEKISVPFFPLLPQADNDGQFITNEEGAIVQYQPGYSGLVEESVQIRRYVIDVSPLKRRLQSLQLELTGLNDNFVKSFTLEHSHNLNQWRRLVSQATFTHLRYGTHSLNKNKVELPANTGRYIRFTWNEDPGGAQLQDVYVLTGYTRRIRSSWQKSTVDGQLVDAEKQIYEFDTGGLFPVEQINILLPENNTLIEASIQAGDGEKPNWRNRYTGLFYKLDVQGNRIENTAVNIRPTKFRYWRLQVKTENGLGSALPTLKFGWHSDELLFVARGRPPFMLAFGSARADTPGKPVDALLRVLNDNQENNLSGNAVIGQEIKLGGVEAVEERIEVDWRKALLWGVLVIAVLLLAAMAFRLYRQMNV